MGRLARLKAGEGRRRGVLTLMLVTVRPVVLRSSPVLEAMMPLPTPEMTPGDH